MSSTTDHTIENLYKKDNNFDGENLTSCTIDQNQIDFLVNHKIDHQLEEQDSNASEIAFLQTVEYMLKEVSPKFLQHSDKYTGGNLHNKTAKVYNGIKNNQIDCEFEQENSNILGKNEINKNKKLMFALMKRQNMLYKENLTLEKQFDKEDESEKIMEDSKMKFISE